MHHIFLMLLIHKMMILYILCMYLYASTLHALTDGVRFMVNRKIFLVGFGLYGSIDAPAEYSVNIQVRMTYTVSQKKTVQTYFFS